MTREELEHAIRAACVTGDSELWVFGSQSILGQDSIPTRRNRLACLSRSTSIPRITLNGST
jgi:hypothetical protein